MAIENFKPETITGIKILAKKLKKRDGIKHSEALDAAARQAGFSSYLDARKGLGEPSAQPGPILPGWALAEQLRRSGDL